MTELLNHIEANKEVFEAWIGSNAELQKGQDIIKPLIPAYEQENNTQEISNGNCHDCILDMIRWALKKLKDSKELPEVKTIKSKKNA